MGLEKKAVRPLALCIQCAGRQGVSLPYRAFTSSAAPLAEAEAQQTSTRAPLDPFTAVTPRQERRLLRATSKVPVGSRRRRAANLYTPGIPLEQLPYQCFQEARTFLQDDRSTKLADIETQRGRIERLQDSVVVGEEAQQRKEHRLISMRRRLEELKILADINDPLVKKKFEDGLGDLSKPIYRFLADRKWRSYSRKVLLQRIEQFKIVPDVLPAIDPVVETVLAFPAPSSISRKLRYVSHGEYVDSRISETPPNIRIQTFDRGEKLVTIAVINPDVPNVEKDSFDARCHFLACNIPISVLKPMVKLGELDESQVLIPWFPAYAQKGAPYQRLNIFILEQPAAEQKSAGSLEIPAPKTIDVGAEKERGSAWTRRDGFSLRQFSGSFGLKPIGLDLFRTQWDEGTAGVMQRAGVPGWDIEFLRKRIDPMPYRRLKAERYR